MVTAAVSTRRDRRLWAGLLGAVVLVGCASPVVKPPVQLTGHVAADDYPSLQAAVDALGDRGGVVHLSARTYRLDRPLRLTRRVTLAGAMDAKAKHAVTHLRPAPDFQGTALVESRPRLARENDDLNADIQLRDLVITGQEGVSGLRLTNCDVLRLERCRIAYVYRCVDITVATDLPRPYPSKIAPGGLFINNCIFQADDICLNLEYATQNRIYANWFVSNIGVALRLKNTNKTWFFANEINTFRRAAVLLEDDGQGNSVHNVFIHSNWMNSNHPESRYVEVINGEKMYNISFCGNYLSGQAGLDLPLREPGRGHVFANNGGINHATSAADRVTIRAGETRHTVRHGLVNTPTFVAVTPLGSAPAHWIENPTATEFDIVLEHPLDQDLTVLWQADLR